MMSSMTRNLIVYVPHVKSIEKMEEILVEMMNTFLQLIHLLLLFNENKQVKKRDKNDKYGTNQRFRIHQDELKKK
jgi:hypothetical protein